MAEMGGVATFFCTNPLYRAVAGRLILPWALQGLRPAGEVLEIGSGSGAMAARLLAAFPDLRVVATDYDPQMVEATRRALRRFNERATVERADASALPFEDGRFDLVLSFAMLHHVPDWTRAVSEALRVLRPGGRLAGFDLLHRSSHGPGSHGSMGPGELEAFVSARPQTSVQTRPARGGFAMRFLVTRAG